LSNKELDKNKIIEKLRQFCAYRERCAAEVLDKLKELDCVGKDAELICKRLEKDDYLNNMRYAEVFAGGKFRINKWGKGKIKQALLKNKISKEYIQLALDSIDSVEYINTLNSIIEKKIKEKDWKVIDEFRKIKLYNFALSKGYEPELIINVINK